MKRTSCSACGSPDLEMFLDLGNSPIADAYTSTPEEISPTYPLQVAVCGKCRLVQLLEVVPAEVLFGTGYSFYSSASAPLSAYHERYAQDVLAAYPELVKRGVVEVGCNDGDLLRHFRHLPHVGVDPSTGPATAARERGLAIWPASFGLDLAGELTSEFGGRKPGVIIANHVLAHVEDVSDFLAGIAHLMDDESIAMIEVQYLPDLLVNNAFDLVYHEHRNFFSLTSLTAAAARYGLHIADANLTDRQGGSIRVTFTKTPQQNSNVQRLLDSERWLSSSCAYEGMQGRAERIRTRLLDLLAGHAGPVAAYGAPAKLTTLAAFCRLDVSMLGWCVDSTPAKQDRHIPGTGIPIVAPGSQPDPGGYLLAAWNYAATIMANNPGNRWILAIPAPVVI